MRQSRLKLCMMQLQPCFLRQLHKIWLKNFQRIKQLKSNKRIKKFIDSRFDIINK